MALALCAAVLGGGAQAHSPYLLPNAFDATGRDHVTIQASFTEHFFVPDVVMKSDDFHAVAPDGARVALTPTYLRDITVFETPTPMDGTWRITSGARIGRTVRAMLVKGEWAFLEPDDPVPAGAAPVDMRSLTTAEVYVSRGKPSAAALAPTGKGLEFHALTHPSNIVVGHDAQFEMLIDGKPLAGQVIDIYRAGQVSAEAIKPVEVISDAAGRFALNVDQPGVYLAMARRLPPPDGKPGQSLTYALTFEAVR